MEEKQIDLNEISLQVGEIIRTTDEYPYYHCTYLYNSETKKLTRHLFTEIELQVSSDRANEKLSLCFPLNMEDDSGKA